MEGFCYIWRQNSPVMGTKSALSHTWETQLRTYFAPAVMNAICLQHVCRQMSLFFTSIIFFSPTLFVLKRFEQHARFTIICEWVRVRSLTTNNRSLLLSVRWYILEWIWVICSTLRGSVFTQCNKHILSVLSIESPIFCESLRRFSWDGKTLVTWHKGL